MRAGRSAWSCLRKRRTRPRERGTIHALPVGCTSRSNRANTSSIPTGSSARQQLGANRWRWPHAPPGIFGRVITAPTPVRALCKRISGDDPGLLRSQTIRGWSICPGPSTLSVGIPRPWERSRERMVAEIWEGAEATQLVPPIWGWMESVRCMEGGGCGDTEFCCRRESSGCGHSWGIQGAGSCGSR